MSFNYNQFTKAELAGFLNKHGNDFKYITKPYQVILEEKINKLHTQVEELLHQNKNLISMLKDEDLTVEERMKASVGLSGNHEMFNTLNKKIDKLHNMMMEG